MALLGLGAFVAWHGITNGREADYERWHSHEHMLERVGIPGFLRGRRYITTTDGPRYLVLYETTDISVLTSPAYLERLNNPTPWTREIMPAVCGMNRTLCHVTASFGCGIGHAALTVRFSSYQGREATLEDWLRTELKQLTGLPGLVAAHLIRADEAASRTPTKEKQLRAQPDEVADWALLVEGYDTVAVRRTWDGPLSSPALEAHGARPRAIGDFYLLAHLVTRQDLPGLAAGPAPGGNC
jgi:hypothetical protein